MRVSLSLIIEVAIVKFIPSASPSQLDEARNAKTRKCVKVCVYRFKVCCLNGTLKGELAIVLEGSHGISITNNI